MLSRASPQVTTSASWRQVQFWLWKHMWTVLLGVVGWWELGVRWGLFLAFVGAAIDGIREVWRLILGDGDVEYQGPAAWPGAAATAFGDAPQAAGYAPSSPTTGATSTRTAFGDAPQAARYAPSSPTTGATSTRTAFGDAPQAARYAANHAPPGERPLPCSLESLDDEAGRCFRFTFDPPLPPGSLVGVFVFAQGCYPDRDAATSERWFGRFYRVTNGRFEAYVPFGEVALPMSGWRVQVQVVLTDGTDPAAPGSPLGRAEWSLPWPNVPSDLLARLRPVVHLALEVACADGPLNRAEVRKIKEYFTSAVGGDRRVLEQLRVTMKQSPRASVERLVEQCRFRWRGIFEPHELCATTLSFLASVAAADGPVEFREGNVIERIARAFGWSETQWATFAARCGIPCGHPWEVLGVSPEATRDEIRAAWRKLVSRYHPDRFARASAREQEEAHRRLIEINEAYERMMGGTTS